MKNNLPVILHAEDDPNDVLLLQQACRSANSSFRPESVEDGDQVISYLSGLDKYSDRLRYPLPVLVLLDLKMSRKTGFEVLEWIRSQPTLKRLPVIILTSSRHEGDVNWTYEHGANSYLVKPVGFDELIKMVKAIELYWLTLSEKPSL